MTLSLAEVRADLSRLVDFAVTTHERITVTRDRKRAAVLPSADDYDSLIETVEILSLPGEMGGITGLIAEIEAGRASSAVEVRAALADRSRRGT